MDDNRELGDDPAEPLTGEVTSPSKIKKRWGRAPGTPNRNSVANLKRSIEKTGMSPLDVLLEGMQRNREVALDLFSKRGTKGWDIEEYLKFDARTAAFASDAAPFCHARLAPRRPEGELPTIDLEGLSDAQLQILVLRLTGRDGGRARLGDPGATEEGGG